MILCIYFSFNTKEHYLPTLIVVFCFLQSFYHLFCVQLLHTLIVFQILLFLPSASILSFSLHIYFVSHYFPLILFVASESSNLSRDTTFLVFLWFFLLTILTCPRIYNDRDVCTYISHILWEHIFQDRVHNLPSHIADIYFRTKGYNLIWLSGTIFQISCFQIHLPIKKT